MCQVDSQQFMETTQEVSVVGSYNLSVEQRRSFHATTQYTPMETESRSHCIMGQLQVTMW